MQRVVYTTLIFLTFLTLIKSQGAGFGRHYSGDSEQNSGGHHTQRGFRKHYKTSTFGPANYDPDYRSGSHGNYDRKKHEKPCINGECKLPTSSGSSLVIVVVIIGSLCCISCCFVGCCLIFKLKKQLSLPLIHKPTEKNSMQAAPLIEASTIVTSDTNSTQQPLLPSPPEPNQENCAYVNNNRVKDEKRDIFLSGVWTSRYFKDGQWYDSHQFHLSFDPRSLKVIGHGTDNVGDYIVTGKYSAETNEIELKKTYRKNVSDPAANLGYTITIEVTWNSQEKKFLGKWYVDTTMYNGEGAFELYFEDTITPIMEHSRHVIFNECEDEGPDIFLSGVWTSRYFQDGHWHESRQLHLSFDPRLFRIVGHGTDVIGDYTVVGRYSIETNEIELKKTYRKHIGDPANNFGHTVTIEITWDSEQRKFIGRWYVATEIYSGEGAYELYFDNSITPIPENSACVNFNQPEDESMAIFPSGVWTSRYFQDGQWYESHQLRLSFDPGSLRVFGQGADDIGCYTMIGRYSIETNEIELKKTYQKNVDDPDENLGHAVTIEVTWNPEEEKFIGQWYVDTESFGGEGSFELEFENP